MDRKEFDAIVREVWLRMEISQADFRTAKLEAYKESQVQTDIRMFEAAHSLRRSATILTKLADEITGHPNADL